MKNNPSQIKNDPGSFKDPAGGIFFYKQKVYRCVAGDSAKFYENLVRSDFFNKLVSKKLFIPSKQAELKHDSTVVKKYGHQCSYFEHDPIEFLTYPFEWSASMLIDAGIHTLKLQERLLRENLSLKDATPYNIQFNFSKPLFIDLCSVENVSASGVWIAMNQFYQTFLYPLLMLEFGVCSLNSVFLSHLDGLTLDETFGALKLRPFWKHALIIDYLLPSIFLKLNNHKILNFRTKPVSNKKIINHSAQIQMLTINRLKKVLLRIPPKNANSGWLNYTRSCTYNDEEYAIKREFIESFLHKFMPSKVLDLGCNIGDFSIIAAKQGCKVISLDSDNECINYLYNISKKANYTILPLCINIVNPSPSIGWLNKERPGFLERFAGKFDCVFALALIHHLIVTSRIPLKDIFRLLKDLSSNYIIVEYVGKEDKKFKELLLNRAENYNDFDIWQFENAASTYFSIIKKVDISSKEKNLNRCIYLMKKPI